MKKMMMVLTTLALAMILAATPLTAFAAAANTDAGVEAEAAEIEVEMLPFGEMTIEEFFEEFAEMYEIEMVTLIEDLPYEEVLYELTFERTGYGAVNTNDVQFTTAEEDKVVEIDADGGAIIIDSLVIISHFSEDETPIAGTMQEGRTYAILETWDLGGANGAVVAAIEAAFILSQENGYISSLHVIVQGNGYQLFKANFVAPGCEQPELPNLFEEEEDEEDADAEDEEAEAIDEVEEDAGEEAQILATAETTAVVTTAVVVPTPAPTPTPIPTPAPTPAPAPTSRRFAEIPADNAGWHSFVDLYGGNIEVRTLKGNLAYQRFLHARHHDNNNTLVHSDVVWETSDGSPIYVPLFNVFVATNGTLIANHFGTQGRHEIRVNLPAGQSFAIIPSNNMGGANYSMASIIEAMWQLAHHMDGLPWIGGRIYGNGQVHGTISATPPSLTN